MITVVIASYRYGHLVANALESVLSQRHPVDKIIIVDDGVGDVESNISKYFDDYSNIKFINRPKNLGTVDNFQDVLMNHVDTERCMFLGADNYLRPDCIEILAKYDEDIISYDIALFGTEVDQFVRHVGAWDVEDGYHIWRFKPGNIKAGNYIHGSSLYNVEKAKKVGYKASGNRNSEEDWMLWKGMLANGATHIHVPEPMLYYRRHKYNFIQLRDKKKLEIN